MPGNVTDQIPNVVLGKCTPLERLAAGSITPVSAASNRRYFPPTGDGDDVTRWQARLGQSWREVGERGTSFPRRVQTVLEDSLMLAQDANGTPYIMPPGRYFKRWRRMSSMQTSVVHLGAGPNPLVTANGQSLNWTYLVVPPNFTCDIMLNRAVEMTGEGQEAVSAITLKPGHYWVNGEKCGIHAFYLRGWRTSSVT